MSVKQKHIYRKLTRQDLHIGEGKVPLVLPDGTPVEGDKINFPRLVTKTEYPTVDDFLYVGEVINWYNPAEDNYRLLVLGGTQENPQVYEITGASQGSGTGGATGGDIVVGYYNPPSGYFGRLLMLKLSVAGQNNFKVFTTGYDSNTTPALYSIWYPHGGTDIYYGKWQLINPPNIPNLLWAKKVQITTSGLRTQYSGHIIWDEKTNLLYLFPRLSPTSSVTPQPIVYFCVHADNGNIAQNPIRVVTALSYFIVDAIARDEENLYILNEEGHIIIINRNTASITALKQLPLADASSGDTRKYVDIETFNEYMAILLVDAGTTISKAIIYIFDKTTFTLVKSFSITSHYYGGSLHYDNANNKLYFALQNYASTEVVLGEIDCATWALTPKLKVLKSNNNYQYFRLRNSIFKRDNDIFFCFTERDTNTDTNYFHLVKLDEQFNILAHAQVSEVFTNWTLAGFSDMFSFEGEIIINTTVEYSNGRQPAVFLLNNVMPVGVFPGDNNILPSGFTTYATLSTSTPDNFTFEEDIETVTVEDGSIIGDAYPSISVPTDVTPDYIYWEQYQS